MDCSPWCCRSWSCDAERVLPITTAPGRGYCGTGTNFGTYRSTVPTVIETCGLLAPFDDMDALRHFSNHVYVKYMGNCRRKEPPRDWVKLESLVNHENLKIKPEQSYYLFGLASSATLARLWAQKVPRPTDEECL